MPQKRRTPQKALSAAQKRAITAYNTAAKAFNTARKKGFKIALKDTPKGRETYKKLYALYKKAIKAREAVNGAKSK